MKKVLFLIPNLNTGGAERCLINLVNAVDKSKFNITVCCIFKCGISDVPFDTNVLFIDGQLPQLYGNSHILKLFSPDYLLNRLTNGEQYDIICSFLEGPSSRIIGLSNRTSKKVLWLHSSINTEKDAIVGFKNKKEAEKAYRTADKIICVSKGVRNSFEKVFGEFLNVTVIHNTNDIQKIIRMSKDENDVTFNKNVLNCISVGRLAKVKAFDRLIRIHKKLLVNGIKNNFYIIGSGSEKKHLNMLIKKFKVQESFFLLGEKENPYKYMAKADVYVCSSLSEGYSTSVTEAIILNVPVITTDCSGMDELIMNRNLGLITDNNEKSLFNGILSILNTDKRIEKTQIEDSNVIINEQCVNTTSVESVFDNI